MPSWVSWAKNAEQGGIIDSLLASRDQFAKEQLDQGIPSLLSSIHSIEVTSSDSSCKLILSEAGARMEEFGTNRLEYLILAIVALERCIK